MHGIITKILREYIFFGLQNEVVIIYGYDDDFILLFLILIGEDADVDFTLLISAVKLFPVDEQIWIIRSSSLCVDCSCIQI